MPITRCGLKKKKYKWGKSGKCYRSRKKALKQGRAITLSKLRRKGVKIARKKRK